MINSATQRKSSKTVEVVYSYLITFFFGAKPGTSGDHKRLSSTDKTFSLIGRTTFMAPRAKKRSYIIYAIANVYFHTYISIFLITPLVQLVPALQINL